MVQEGLRVVRMSLAILTLFGLLVTPPSGHAQSQDSNTIPAWVQFTIAQVEPDMVPEFLAIQDALMQMAKDGGKPWRTVSRTAVFGDQYRFVIATPGESLASFASLDKKTSVNSSLYVRLEKTISSFHSYAVRTLPALDNPLPADRIPTVMVINISKVAPGREQEYYRIMEEDVFPHFNEAEMYHSSGSLALGGEGGYIHLFYLDDFASLDQGSPVVRALGPSGAQVVTAKLSGIVISTEQWVARLLPELSFGPWSKDPEAGHSNRK